MKKYLRMSSAAVVIGALRVKIRCCFTTPLAVKHLYWLVLLSVTSSFANNVWVGEQVNFSFDIFTSNLSILFCREITYTLLLKNKIPQKDK